jgi:hypothetical protein
MPAITLPQQLDLSITPLQLTPGTYTELVNDSLGPEDWSTGPSLAPIDQGAQLVASMGDDPIGAGDISSTLVGLGGTIPQQGASTFAADMQAAQAAQDAKVATYNTALSELPPVLELPISPGGNFGLSVPPTQTSVALGNLPVGGAPGEYRIGTYNMPAKGYPTGVNNPTIADATNATAGIEESLADTPSGGTIATYTAWVRPTAPGPVTVQINYYGGGSIMTIVTLTATGVAAS